SFGTSASMSTMTGAFRESFFQFSIPSPPCSYYTRRTSPPARFFDKLKKASAKPMLFYGWRYCDWTTGLCLPHICI
ncbi:hypothetical protein, partial [Dysosmobacter sp.]|uniref:hypothetical protein n=1 Tax=Dysosmobacter sp. TaxID=2591382 RepID=UPI002A9F19AA